MTFSADASYAYRPRARGSLIRDVSLVLTAAAAAAGVVAAVAHLSAAPPTLQIASTSFGRNLTQAVNAGAMSHAAALSRAALASADRAAFPLSLSAPLRAAFQHAGTQTPERMVVASLQLSPAAGEGAGTSDFIGPVAPPDARLADRAADFLAPLPVPRPAELAAPVRTTIARRSMPGSEVAALRQSTPPKTPGLFERLFGSSEPSGPALAYANPQDGLGVPKSLVPVTPVSPDRTTAVYDITARTVTLPDGTRLEAHSGLREFLDDPRQVHVKMKGATPPATYDLTLREKLFHGVEALRLTPVNSGVHGRVGLLAHTYMLGPNGDSNGCVSFRNYEAFLQAFKRGHVTRLVVVARAN